VDHPKHHFRDDDIKEFAAVVNNPLSVRLTARPNRQGLKIVEFKGNIKGVVYFAATVHKKHGGWLSLISAYRSEKSKVSGEPMPPDSSPELTPKTPRPMPSPSLSQRTLGKSSRPPGLENYPVPTQTDA